MKKLTTILAVIAILLLSFTSCDKYHRDRYTGTWEFVTERRYYIGCDDYECPIEVRRDTVYYTGKISCRNSEYGLIFQYTENDEVGAWVDKDGYIYSEAGIMLGKYACGHFESKNKLYFELHWGEYINFEGDTDRRYDYITGTKKGRR